MHWTIDALLIVGPLLLIGLVFLVLGAVLRRTGGYAPGWQLRCVKCGCTRDAGEAGVVRVGAASVGKRVLAYCHGCSRYRMVALERRVESA